MVTAIKLGFLQPSVRIQEENGMITMKFAGVACMFSKKDLTGISLQRQGLFGIVQFMGNGTSLGKMAIAGRHAQKVMAELNKYFGF